MRRTAGRSRVATGDAGTEQFFRWIWQGRRGRLKVFFGYAPAVGKTHEMLREATRLQERGIDVMIDHVDDRGCPRLRSLALVFEAAARRRLEHRGHAVPAMDLEAVLERRPEVLVVDDLARVNPSSRNRTCHDDVMEILDAGIHVLTTLDLGDIGIGDETGRGRSTSTPGASLPRTVLERADQVVHVDPEPRVVLRRLREKEGRGAGLSQGPELRLEALEALRREAREEIRAAARSTVPPGREAGGRAPVIVCVSSMGPDPGALVRYGARLAAELGREWFVLHVYTSTGSAVRDEMEERRMEKVFGLAEELGGIPFRYRSDDVAGTILRFARDVEAGHVVVGRSARLPWWRRLFGREDLMSRLLREAAGLTVIVVDPEGREVLRRKSERGPRIGPPEAGPGGESTAPSLAELLAGGEIVIFDRPILRNQAVRRLVEALGERQPGIDAEALVERLEDREGELFPPVQREDLHVVHLSAPRIPRPVAALGLLRMTMNEDAAAVGVIVVLVTPEDEGEDGSPVVGRVRSLLADREAIGRVGAALDPAGVLDAVADLERRAADADSRGVAAEYREES